MLKLNELKNVYKRTFIGELFAITYILFLSLMCQDSLNLCLIDVWFLRLGGYYICLINWLLSTSLFHLTFPNCIFSFCILSKNEETLLQNNLNLVYYLFSFSITSVKRCNF